jgi:hypothetical protein
MAQRTVNMATTHAVMMANFTFTRMTTTVLDRVCLAKILAVQHAICAYSTVLRCYVRLDKVQASEPYILLVDPHNEVDPSKFAPHYQSNKDRCL